jgi:hypothetical protein
MKKRVMGAIPTEVDGIKFDSRKEARRWMELVLLQRAGEITDLERQVSIELLGRDANILTPTGRPMRYVADFRYYDRRLKATVIEDAKGHPTDVYRMKKAILAAMGIAVRET